MDFNEYQIQARRTAVYPHVGNNLWYPALGLASEAGEAAGKIKKIYRDKGGRADQMTISFIAEELGDILWYISAISSELGISLDRVAEDNLTKLEYRKMRDKLRGDGDHR